MQNNDIYPTYQLPSKIYEIDADTHDYVMHLNVKSADLLSVLKCKDCKHIQANDPLFPIKTKLTNLLSISVKTLDPSLCQMLMMF